MPTTRDRLLALAHGPRQLPEAALGRFGRPSARFGPSWIQLPGGSVTLRQRGSQYAQLLAPLSFIEHKPIAEVAAISGMSTPDEVMVFCG